MAASRRVLLPILALLAAGLLWVAAPPSPASAEFAAGDSTFFPVRPCRLLDTRQSGGPVQPGAPGRTVRVAGSGSCNIPEDALSLEATITAVKPKGGGFLRVSVTGVSTSTTFLNYVKGEDATSTGSFAITPGPPNGGGFTIRTFAGATDVVVDVQGYHRQATTTPEGALYVPAVTCRAYDSRSGDDGQRLVAGDVVDVAITAPGGCGVPPTAVAAEVTVTVAEAMGPGFVKVWPAGQPTPNATFLTQVGGPGTDDVHPGGRSTSNTGTVAIRSGSYQSNLRVRLYGKPAHVIVDVQGWWVPAPAAPAATFKARRPGCRVLDTRKTGGPVAPIEVRGVKITQVPGCNIPTNAVAIEATITAVDQAGSGYLRAWAAGSPGPSGSVLSFPDRGSTGTTIAVPIRPGTEDPNLLLQNYGSSTQYVVDIEGWYIPTA